MLISLRYTNVVMGVVGTGLRNTLMRKESASDVHAVVNGELGNGNRN